MGRHSQENGPDPGVASGAAPLPTAASTSAPATSAPAAAVPAAQGAESGPPDVRATLVGLLDRTGAIADSAGRRDLLDRLGQARSRVLDPRLRIVVVGQLKQGKSQLVNSLLGSPVCTVGDDEATAVITVAHHAPQPVAHLVVASAGSVGGRETGGEPERVPIPLDAIQGITPTTPLAQGREVLRLEVGIPSPVLAEGIVLIDTPGVGGKATRHAANTLAMIPSADAVLWVSDASQEFTEPELGFLRQVTSLCPAVACLLSKIDLYPHWRQVLEADERHLRGAGLELPILPVSSLLRGHAVQLRDESLNAESGFLELFAFLRQAVERSDVGTRRSVALDVGAVADHVSLALNSELESLRDPDQAAQVVEALEKTRESAERLRQKSSLWQQTLADGIGDLASDIDHDLRDRLRRVTREAEEAVDEGDPEKDWEALGEWLEEQTAAAVGDNFVWAHERAVWLAEVIAQHFAEVGEAELPQFGGPDSSTDADGALAPVAELADLESGKVGITQKVLIGMRGSYGGVVMFGLVTTMMGMVLVNPISLGAGVILGTKAYREDKANRTQRMRAEAKAAIRRYTDDVSFQVGKESRDRLRQVQRLLRDHFQGVAEQTVRSLGASVQSAQEAANTEVHERQSRIGRIEQELRVLAELKSRAAELGPA